MKNYLIYKQFGKDVIKAGDMIRVDLFNGYKMKDIEELKKFNLVYEQKGHDDVIRRKGKEISRKVRYIKVYNKK